MSPKVTHSYTSVTCRFSCRFGWSLLLCSCNEGSFVSHASSSRLHSYVDVHPSRFLFEPFPGKPDNCMWNNFATPPTTQVLVNLFRPYAQQLSKGRRGDGFFSGGLFTATRHSRVLIAAIFSGLPFFLGACCYLSESRISFFWPFSLDMHIANSSLVI